MSELGSFLFGEQQVRVVGSADEPLFVAKDVCEILELNNPTRAVDGLDEDELTLLKVRAGGQQRDMNAVTESGLYHLIFKSRKAAAKRFRRWVTEEVLPEIRKRGKYVAQGEYVTLPEWLKRESVDLSREKAKAGLMMNRAWAAAKLMGFRGAVGASGYLEFHEDVLTLASEEHVECEEASLLQNMEVGRTYSLMQVAELLGCADAGSKKVQSSLGKRLNKIIEVRFGDRWLVKFLGAGRRVCYRVEDAKLTIEN